MFRAKTPKTILNPFLIVYNVMMMERGRSSFVIIHCPQKVNVLF